MIGYSFGQRGDAIRDVQSLLAASGLYTGRIDGQFGPKTDQAVKQWQGTIGEKVDGWWGPKTLIGTARYLSKFNDMNALANGAEVVVPSLGRVYEQR